MVQIETELEQPQDNMRAQIRNNFGSTQEGPKHIIYSDKSSINPEDYLRQEFFMHKQKQA